MNPTANWSLIPNTSAAPWKDILSTGSTPAISSLRLRLTICSGPPNLPIKPTEPALAYIADFFRLHAPHECSGSKANFKAWIVSAGSC